MDSFTKGDERAMLLQPVHDRTGMAIRIATTLLKQKGELSISDIKAILSLSDSQEVVKVVDYLISHFNGELYQKKVKSRPIAQWEQFIRIKQ